VADRRSIAALMLAASAEGLKSFQSATIIPIYINDIICMHVGHGAVVL
jgi:hypothetical protein